MFPFENKEVNTTDALIAKENYRHNVNNTVVVYFSSEDCLIRKNKVIKAGRKILKLKIPIGEFGFVSLITNTEGNTIRLHSRN